jgi:hypothetical protein
VLELSKTCIEFSSFGAGEREKCRASLSQFLIHHPVSRSPTCAEPVSDLASSARDTRADRIETTGSTLDEWPGARRARALQRFHSL